MPRKLVVVAASIAVVLFGASPAWAPRSCAYCGKLLLYPVDGAHWEAQAGLPDSRGNANQGLVRSLDTTDAHSEAAIIKGLEGASTSDLQTLGFAVFNERASIVPCVKVAYTDASDRTGEIMITSRMMRAAREPAPEGWKRYVLDGTLPEGTIESVELGVHIDNPNILDGDFVIFDDVIVNDQMWTQAADNA